MRQVNIPGKSYTRPKTPEEAEVAIERSKNAKRDRNSQDYRSESKQVVKDRNFDTIKKKIALKEKPFTISLININEVTLDGTTEIINQIMVMYKSGEWEVLPSRVNGTNIREYLGFKYSRITYWTMLPINSSPNHPAHFSLQIGKGMTPFSKKPKDVFNV